MRNFRIAPSCTRCGAHRPCSGYTEVKVEGTFKGEHYRYWAVRSSRGLSQCLDSGLPIKHKPISFMRWQGFDPTPASWDFLSVAAAALTAGVGRNPFHLRFSGASELLICHAHLASSFLTGSLSAETLVDYPVPLEMGYFHGDSPGGPWYDRDSSSSCLAVTTWIFDGAPDPVVEGDGNVFGAHCVRTSDYCVSLVTVHVGPTWVSFKGPPTKYGEGHGPPASLWNGRVQARTRLALGHDHRNVCERMGRDQPTRMGEGKSQ